MIKLAKASCGYLADLFFVLFIVAFLTGYLVPSLLLLTAAIAWLVESWYLGMVLKERENGNSSR